jgi:hypothetical protein
MNDSLLFVYLICLLTAEVHDEGQAQSEAKIARSCDTFQAAHDEGEEARGFTPQV